jgi:hypothetical protein
LIGRALFSNRARLFGFKLFIQLLKATLKRNVTKRFSLCKSLCKIAASILVVCGRRPKQPKAMRPSRPLAEGEYVAATYRKRLSLASGRFAMIDDGLGFSLRQPRLCARHGWEIVADDPSMGRRHRARVEIQEAEHVGEELVYRSVVAVSPVSTLAGTATITSGREVRQ